MAPPVPSSAADAETARPVAAPTQAGGPQLVWPAIALAGVGVAGLIGAGVLGVMAGTSWSEYLDARYEIATVDGADYTLPGLQRTYFEAQIWTTAAAVVATLGAAGIGAGLAWQLLALEDDAVEEAAP